MDLQTRADSGKAGDMAIYGNPIAPSFPWDRTRTSPLVGHIIS